MRLCEIMEKLDNYAITVLEGKNLETDITGIRMITKDQTVFLSNILYFGSISQLPEVSQNGYCVNFLCYGSLTELTGILDSGVDVNCLLISSREDAFAIYNQIQDIFLESEQVVTGMRAFLDALFEDKGLQGLCDVAYGILGNPLFIVDNSYKYLAFSSGTVADSQLMEKETMMGQIAEEGIRQIRKMQLDDKIRRSGRPLYFFNPVHKSGMLVGPVTIHDIEVGHVMLYDFAGLHPLNSRKMISIRRIKGQCTPIL